MESQQAVLVFTDLVGSVKLQQHVGPAVYGRLKARHDGFLKSALERCPNGEIIETTGDGFYLRFPTCSAAVETCLRFQHALLNDDQEDFKLRARIGIHSGEVSVHDGVTNRLLGMAPNITARVMGLALPGQILVTEPVFHDASQYVREHPAIEQSAEKPALRWLNHGEYSLQGADFPIGIFEVGAVGMAPLRTPPSTEKATRLLGDVRTRADDEPLSNYDIWKELLWIGKAAFAIVVLVCGWFAWTFYSTKANNRAQSVLASPLNSPGETTSSQPPLIVKPPPPAKTYEIEITRLTCLHTNDFDGVDQVTLELKADDKLIAIQYPNNYEGTPCKDLKEGEVWEMGEKATFEKRVVADFEQLDGIPGPIGRATINPSTLDNKIDSTEWKPKGANRRHYRVEWRVVK